MALRRQVGDALFLVQFELSFSHPRLQQMSRSVRFVLGGHHDRAGICINPCRIKKHHVFAARLRSGTGKHQQRNRVSGFQPLQVGHKFGRRNLVPETGDETLMQGGHGEQPPSALPVIFRAILFPLQAGHIVSHRRQYPGGSHFRHLVPGNFLTNGVQ